MDAKKFIRKLSTGRDTGFRESGSRVILDRTFSLYPSISCPFSQSGPVKVDRTSNQPLNEPGGTYKRFCWRYAVLTQSVLKSCPQRILDDFFKFRIHYHPPTPCTNSIPFSVLESPYYHILLCWFEWLLNMKVFSKFILMMLAQPTGEFLSGENHICPNWFSPRNKKSHGRAGTIDWFWTQ